MENKISRPDSGNNPYAEGRCGVAVRLVGSTPTLFTMNTNEIQIKKISHSQAATYNNCNYKWYLSYVEGWRTKTLAGPPHTGILIHELLQVFYDNFNKLGAVESYALVKLKALEQVQALIEEDANLLPRASVALKITEKYIRQFSPYEDKNWNVLATEYHFEAPIVTPNGREITIEGYIDVLVSINGKLWIVDHKSVVSRFWDEVQIQLDSQFTTYAACMNILGYPVQGIIVNQVNTYQYKDYEKEPVEKFFRRVRTLRSQTEQQNTLREVAFVIDDIVDHLERDRPFKKSLTKDCKNCNFAEVCMYTLKGLDVQGFLQQNHKQKTARPQETNTNAIFEIETP